MSDIDKYSFSRTLEELRSFSNLLSCSLCSAKLTTASYSTGKCLHLFCSRCHENSKSSNCPVQSCEVPTQPKDYQENRTITQVAQCLENIENLLLRPATNQPPPETKTKQNDDGKPKTKVGVKGKAKAKTKKESPSSSTVARRGSRRTKSLDYHQLNNGITATRGRKRTSTVTRGNAKTVCKPGNLEKKNAQGETGLHVACRKGQTAKVRDLLDKGSDPNTRDYAGKYCV